MPAVPIAMHEPHAGPSHHASVRLPSLSGLAA